MMRNSRFEGSFRKYYRLVKYVVLEKTSDPLLAEEIEQQVFCEFYMHLDEIRPESEKAWLLRCTKNKLADHMRREQRWSTLVIDSGHVEIDNLRVDEAALFCEERIMMRELTARILHRLKEVNMQWYEILELCFVEELSYAEAAEQLCITTSVLRSRLYRARAYIRKVFWDEYKKGEPET